MLISKKNLKLILSQIEFLKEDIAYVNLLVCFQYVTLNRNDAGEKLSKQILNRSMSFSEALCTITFFLYFPPFFYFGLSSEMLLRHSFLNRVLVGSLIYAVLLK